MASLGETFVTKAYDKKERRAKPVKAVKAPSRSKRVAKKGKK